MEQDPRVAQALADLIEQHGPEASALKEAIAKGDVEISYELVRSQPSGKIKLSKFELDEKPIAVMKQDVVYSRYGNFFCWM